MDDAKRVRWRDLSGQDRLRLIEQVRQGRLKQADLCRTFGMSRQVLHRAIKAMEEAAVEALEPKRPGRKPVPVSDQEVRQLKKDLTHRDRELAHLQQKYEVTQTLLELERKLDRGELLPGEKKRRKRR